MFPCPNFDDEEEDAENSISIISDLPTEKPFSSHQNYNFSHFTTQNIRYDLTTPVYSSPSSSVYIARSNSDPPAYYALKSSSYIRRIRNEHDVYQIIGNHPTIIACQGTWVQNGVAFLQLELAQEGSIRSHLFSFSNNQIWKIFSHISFALAKLHSVNYMHLDVSPSNILQCKQDSEDIFKLTDFGTALAFGTFDEGDEGAGPYVSPEALAYPDSEFEVGAPTDIFSFGTVLLELVTKKLAPRAEDNYQKFRNGNYNFANYDIPTEFTFIKDMLHFNPNQRPTAEHLLSMPRVQEELQHLRTKIAKTPSKPHTAHQATTPPTTTSRLPPETPYTTKYDANKRRLVFDDNL